MALTEILSAALLPALFAGAVAIAATIGVERWGGVAGGFLGTMPSTIVPASLGIAASAGSPAAFAAAMGTVPAGMLVNAIYLYLWRALPPHLPAVGLGARLALMLSVSLLAWAGLSAGAVLLLRDLHASGAGAVLLGLGLTLLIGAMGVLACWRLPPAPRGQRAVGPAVLAARGLLAAAAIGVSVALSRLGSPLAAGVASVFPAIFTTTMASLWLAQGEAVQGGAVGPMMLGSASVGTYAILAAVLMPALGPGWGAALAWVGAVLSTTLPAWRWTHRRHRSGA